MREKFWRDVWIATASSSNCAKLGSPTLFADEACKQYDVRFASPQISIEECTELGRAAMKRDVLAKWRQLTAGMITDDANVAALIREIAKELSAIA
jgi:hypothetical protein